MLLSFSLSFYHQNVYHDGMFFAGNHKILTYHCFQEVFRDIDPSVHRMLSLCLEERMYLPHQIVTARDVFGHSMYYIIRGEVEVRHNTGFPR